MPDTLTPFNVRISATNIATGQPTGLDLASGETLTNWGRGFLAFGACGTIARPIKVDNVGDVYVTFGDLPVSIGNELTGNEVGFMMVGSDHGSPAHCYTPDVNVDGYLLIRLPDRMLVVDGRARIAGDITSLALGATDGAQQRHLRCSAGGALQTEIANYSKLEVAIKDSLSGDFLSITKVGDPFALYGILGLFENREYGATSKAAAMSVLTLGVQGTWAEMTGPILLGCNYSTGGARDNYYPLKIDSSGRITVAAAACTQSGTWNIGTVTTVSTVTNVTNIATSVTPGTGAGHLGKAEDAAHASGDTGVMALAVRTDIPGTSGNIAGTDKDYIALQTNAKGALWTHPDWTTGTKAFTTTGTQVFDLSKTPKSKHTLQVVNTANVTAFTVDLEISLDGTNYLSAGQVTGTTGNAILFKGDAPALYVRFNCSILTGSSPTLTITWLGMP
jgi:hypothetical protein